MTTELDAELQAVARISAIPTMLDVVCRTTGMGFAAVARVTADRWIACTLLDTIDFGLKPGGELKLDTTICNEIRLSGAPVIIDSVTEDPEFCSHPTPALYGFQSYISVPIIRTDGTFFGTLCAIDPRPALLNTPQVTGMFKLFAELIAFHLDAEERVMRSEAALSDERKTGELREQFVAVLGHDLRNPLASIDAGMRLLARGQLGARETMIVQTVQNSAQRMAGLIDNVMDFARARLGQGLSVLRDADKDVAPVIEQVVQELRLSFQNRRIDLLMSVAHDVSCDRGRLAQLLSNLVGNALTHGDPASPIKVTAATDGSTLELAVANQGTPIPAAITERLFQPFFRGGERVRSEGLGLGLYIASEIARAHSGTLNVRSTSEETRFTARIPLN